MSEEYQDQNCAGCGQEDSSECTHDCSSCGHSCGQPQDLHEPCNPHSVIRHVIGVVSGKGGVGKCMVTSPAGGHHAPPGLPGRHPGCRRHRSLHPQGLRHPRPGHGQRGGPVSHGVQNRHPGDEHQPAAAQRDGPGHLAGPGHLRRGPAVLDRRAVELRLSVRGHAAGNRRRVPQRVPVHSPGRHRIVVPPPRSWSA